MNFIRRLKRGTFYLSIKCFEIWLSSRDMKFATNEKFQLSFSKIMPARPKNAGTCDVNTTRCYREKLYF